MTPDEQDKVRELGDIAHLLVVQVIGHRLKAKEGSKQVRSEMRPYKERIETLLLGLGL